MLSFLNCDDTRKLKDIAIGSVFEFDGDMMMKVYVGIQNKDICTALTVCCNKSYIYHIESNATAIYEKYRLLEWDEKKGKDVLFREIKPNDTFLYDGSPYVFTNEKYVISLRTGRGYALSDFLKFHDEEAIVTLVDVVIKWGVWK